MPTASSSCHGAETAALYERIAQLEQELAESRELASSVKNLERFTRQALGTSRIAVAIFTVDLQSATFVSANAERNLGCSAEQFRADPSAWLQFVHDDDRTQVAASLAGVSPGKSTEVIFRVHRGDELGWTRARFAWNSSADATPTIVAFFSDITDLKRSEAAALESEERFRVLTMHSPMGIFHCDAHGNSSFVNERYLTISGLVADECGGQGWLRTLHPDDRAEVKAAWCQAVASRTEFACEYRYLHDDGTLRWVLAKAVPLADAAGHVSGFLGNVLDITDRQAAEEAVRASENRFRLLSNNSPVGIFCADQAGRVVYVNPRLESIYGYEAKELFGLGFARIFQPQVREALTENWIRIAASNELHDAVRHIVHGSGAMRWIHVRSTPMVAPNGTILGRVGTIEDITDRREFEHELHEGKERYRLLAEHATDMITKSGLDGRLRYVSPACRTLLGYEPQELLARPAIDLLHPDDRKLAVTSFRDALPSPSTGAITCRVRRKDGRYVWFETRWKSVPSAPGNELDETELVAVSRDVTVRRQVAERLRASEARMRGILNTAVDGILTVDEAGVIEMFNRGAERLFGYRAAEVLGQNVGMLLSDHESDHRERRARRPAVFRRPLANSREVVGRRKDGSKCELEMRVGETTAGGRSIFTAILHDISDRKRTERVLRETEKLAAVGRIAAQIAHEINNPLAGIKSSFALVKDLVPRDDPHYGYVGRIEREIDRIARIVRQMFNVYGPPDVTFREVELADTVRDVVALLSAMARGRDVTLEVSATRTSGPVRLPEDFLRQVLYNVIINAIEASPPGRAVRIGTSSRGGQVEIFVADEGAGIPEEIGSQIYEPFFTTKAAGRTGGLGLGLPISRSIVEAMQGTLDFESVPNCGTIFHLRLPVGPP